VIGIDLLGHAIYRLSDRLSGTTNVFQVAAPQAGLQLFHGVIKHEVSTDWAWIVRSITPTTFAVIAVFESNTDAF